MIQFKVLTDESMAVKLEVDGQGDLVLKANGVIVLWLLNDGRLMRADAFSDRERMKAMGFQLNKHGEVRLTDEREED